jgi:cell wall assembly regulator SMI1
MGVGEAWKRIEAWLAAEAADVLPSLLPGASEDDITELESSVGAKLPADFRESLHLHGGQSDDAESGLFPYSSSLGTAPAWRLLSIEEIGERREQMNELVEIGEFAGRKGNLPAGEQTEWWPAAWLPIADDGGGDFACLDLSPAGAGRVVQFCHDSPKRKVFAPSFGAWLATLADELEAGKYHFDPDDWGLQEIEEDDG